MVKVLWIVMLSIVVVSAQPFPRQGQSFTIEYNPSLKQIFNDSDSLQMVYVFDYWGSKYNQWQGKQMMFMNVQNPDSGRITRCTMQRNGKVWQAEVAIPHDVSLLSYYITNGDRYDYNDGNTYIHYICREDGIPVKNARYRNLDFMLMGGKSDSARLKEIEQELKDYPENFPALIPYWQLRINARTPYAVDSLLIFKQQALEQVGWAEKNGVTPDSILNYQAGVHYVFTRSVKQVINQIYNEIEKSDSLFETIMAGIDEEKRHPTLNRQYQQILKYKQEQAIYDSFKTEIVSKPAPNFTAGDINGNKITLSKLKGKVVLLEFWATWCGPCVAKIPELKKLYNQYHSQGLEIISISVDAITGSLKTDQQLKKFTDLKGMNWTIILDKTDQSIAGTYKIVHYPTLFLVDRQGMIAENENTLYQGLDKKITEYLRQN